MRTLRQDITVTVLVLLSVAALSVPAQSQVSESGNEAAQPPVPAAEKPQPEEATPAPPPAPPPPGPEVMRPVSHGVRMTPGLARGFGRVIAGEWRDDLNTTPDQQQQLGDRLARRLMELGRKHQRDAQPALEYLITAMIKRERSSGDGLNLAAEDAREFAQRCAPLVPLARETLDAFEQEGESILTPDQKDALRKRMQKARDGTRHLEEVLNRWAQGGYREGDNPFEPAKPSEAEGAGPNGTDAPGTATTPAKPEMRNAQAVAKMNLEQIGPTAWTGLLNAAKQAFNFDDEQVARANQLLADYRGKADVIMTPEWKQAVRANRIKSHLNNWLRGQPSRPFFFHLQQEYARLTDPVKNLGLAFRADLLAIATPEQRAAAVAEVQNAATTVGLSLTPDDEKLLGLTVTQAVAATP